ncbi:MAG: hypothetical protein UHX00_15565 [Caryophanon sp.]|nr:hypothetical protein [Caryophanon sp.]
MKKYLIGIFCLAILCGCSEQIDELESENIDKKIMEESGGKITESTEKDAELAEVDNDSDAKSEIIATDMTEENIVVEEKKEELMEESSETASTLSDNIKEDSLYESYIAQKEISSNLEAVSEVKSKENIIFNLIDEETIELPVYEENKTVFSSNLKEVSFQELMESEIIELVEDPIVQGYLIGVDLVKLGELYEGESYSVLYQNIEYPLMLSEVYPTIGLTEIGNVSKEDLNKATVLIMKQEE